jgi:hypothetical protein
MPEAALSPFISWESFYVIVGSSAGALTGLQFVVIALVAELRTRTTSHQIAAFGTPTIVHFSAVLTVSAILSAPWHGLSSAAFILSCCGAAGITYEVIVIRRAVRQTGYKPVIEDWLWHAVFPLISYSLLLIAAILLPHHSTAALFEIGSSALFLLLIGIHNAWDTVVYIAVDMPKKEGDSNK